MKLIHYTNKEFKLETRPYLQSELRCKSKPRGLWVSIEGEQDWKCWCEDENFNLENLIVSYEVKLKKKANILHLKTQEEVINFGREYPYIKPQWDNPEGREIFGSYELDWPKVKEKYQGIIIAPFQHDLYLLIETSWYYGWDCASGCIWDLECIEELTLIGNG